jgi:RNA polymerase sigma-70 factor (ECF subfamily)
VAHAAGPAGAPGRDVPEREEQRGHADELLREVLLECYYRGASVAEAARRLGIPPGTVKSRTHYALRALRLVLEELGLPQ